MAQKDSTPKTVEVKVTSNPKHRGIVDLKVKSTDHTGAMVGKNGIRWSI